MLLLNISSIYLRCGVLIKKSESLERELDIFKDKFQYINPKLFIEYKSAKIILFKINFLKIEEFSKSPDFEFLSKIKIIQNLEQKEKEIIEHNISQFKDNNKFLSEPIFKDKELSKCYYCGYLTGKIEYLIYKLFQKKCEKIDNLIQLTISGIDYINNNLENSFFDLPKSTINDLVIVGKKENKTNLEKNKLTLKDKLYPYLLTTGDSDLSVYKVDSINTFKKIGYNSMGPSSFWSLLNLTCKYDEPELALKEAKNGNNKLIDLSVGDIYGGNYGGESLCSDLIASSFSKISSGDNIKKIDKKDIAKALLIFYGVTYAQVASMVSLSEKTSKNIISGDTFESLELMQMIQNCFCAFNGNTIEAVFNDYSTYFEIIGMIIDLDKNGKLENETM